MSRFSGEMSARWFNPASGSYSQIAGSPFANSGSMDFSTPGDNGTGMNDWVLILEAKFIHEAEPDIWPMTGDNQ